MWAVLAGDTREVGTELCGVGASRAGACEVVVSLHVLPSIHGALKNVAVGGADVLAARNGNQRLEVQCGVQLDNAKNVWAAGVSRHAPVEVQVRGRPEEL